MDKKKLRLIAGILILFIILSAFIFSYKQDFFEFSKEINSQRFAEYAIFISSFLSIATIFLVYLTFKETRATNELALKNFSNSSFFNLFQAHLDIAKYLHTQMFTELRLDYVTRRQANGDESPKVDQRSFFELTYGILDATYKTPDHKIDRHRIEDFFKRYDWLFGHYFRGLAYSIRWIHFDSAVANREKTFYINFLRSHISSDEMRLTFYYVISRQDPERAQMLRICDHRKFFDPILAELIMQGGDDSDLAYYNKLLEDAKRK